GENHRRWRERLHGESVAQAATAGHQLGNFRGPQSGSIHRPMTAGNGEACMAEEADDHLGVTLQPAKLATGEPMQVVD
ncbi:hypothetical protein, partial [Microvirga tunisiensis]|uniref:hypothetical protein n=1 Tax=Microvirga tunisiensis TaxID=2108360 RepID=UPI001FCE70C2